MISSILPCYCTGHSSEILCFQKQLFLVAIQAETDEKFLRFHTRKRVFLQSFLPPFCARKQEHLNMSVVSSDALSFDVLKLPVFNQCTSSNDSLAYPLTSVMTLKLHALLPRLDEYYGVLCDALS